MKKRLLGIVLTCALAACSLVGLAGCNSDTTVYTPQQKEAVVSTPTIGVDGVLRVGVNTTNPPMAGQTTKIVGIDVDIAAALADELGLKLEVVDVGNNPVASLNNGTVDIVLGLESTNTDAALWKSDPYIQTGIAVFALEPSTPAPTEGSKIAAQGTSLSAWNVSSEYGVDSLVNAADLNEAFTYLANGEVQYVVSDAVMGTYSASVAGVGAHIIALESEPTGYCVATLASNTELSALIAQYMGKLSQTGIVAVIENKWMSTTIDLTNVSLTEPAKAAIAAKEAEEAEAAAAAEGEEAAE